MNVHISQPTAEVEQLKAAVLFLSVALACATQPTSKAMARQVWRTLRPPLAEGDLERIASVWELEPSESTTKR